MPLSTHKIQTASVRLSKDNSFLVRGITFPDLTMIVQSRLPDLVAIVSKYMDLRTNPQDKATMGNLAIMLSRDFPTLVVEMISACVYGEKVDDAMRETIRNLPVAVQLDAINNIMRLTAEEAGGLGNLLSDLRERMSAVGEGGPGEAPIPSA